MLCSYLMKFTGPDGAVYVRSVYQVIVGSRTQFPRSDFCICFCCVRWEPEHQDDNTRLAVRANNREERSKAGGEVVFVGAPMKRFKYTDEDFVPAYMVRRDLCF